MRTAMLAAFALVACTDGGTQVTDQPIDINTVTATERPAGRSEVFGVVDESTGQMMIFGGNEGPIVNQNPRGKFLQETWVFSPGIGWSEVVSETTPARRGRYAVQQDDANGRALMFGGRFRQNGADSSTDYRLYNDLWAFDWTSRAWTKLSDADDDGGPAGRYYPASAFDAASARFYIWGGALNASPLFIEPGNDLWSWSDDEGWMEHTITGEGPSTRTFLGDTYDSSRNRIIIFGGQRGDFSSLAFNDTWALSLEDYTWTQLHDGETGKAPSTRMHAALQYDEAADRYLLFGGHTDEGDGNDVWAFDPTTNAWSVLTRGDRFTGNSLGCIDNPSEVPADYVNQDLDSPERRHRGMHTLLDGRLWIFGGIHSECSDYLDDVWHYDLQTNAWTEVMESRTGESCARRGDDCVCLCL